MNDFGEKVSFIWSVADLLRDSYIPPRPLDEIESDLQPIEKEIADMLAEATE